MWHHACLLRLGCTRLHKKNDFWLPAAASPCFSSRRYAGGRNIACHDHVINSREEMLLPPSLPVHGALALQELLSTI